jgi:hypothetical protein
MSVAVLTPADSAQLVSTIGEFNNVIGQASNSAANSGGYGIIVAPNATIALSGGTIPLGGATLKISPVSEAAT